MLEHLYRAFVGNKRQTSDRIILLAQKGRRNPASLTEPEIRSICMSLISQARS